jgi:hypothetical protein
VKVTKNRPHIKTELFSKEKQTSNVFHMFLPADENQRLAFSATKSALSMRVNCFSVRSRFYLFDKHEVQTADLRLRAPRRRRVVRLNRLTQTQL